VPTEVRETGRVAAERADASYPPVRHRLRHLVAYGLSALADDSRWGGFNQSMAYNASASFLAYLLERDGPDRLRQLYGVSSGEFEARFSQIYGRPLAQAETEWKEFCAGWGG